MTVLSFDDVNGNGITRDATLDTGDVFDSRVKNTNYGGTGGSNNTLIYYQGSGAAARKVGSTGGHGFTVGNYTSRDTTTATYRTVVPKIWITNFAALNPAGVQYCIGSGTGAAIGNEQHYWIMGDDGTIAAPGFEVPVKGGFIVKPVDVTLRAFLEGTTLNPTETAMVNHAAWVDLNTTAGTDQNLVLDSPDYVETGFHVVGGTSTDPRITYQDVVDEDEGSGSTNFARVGLWQTLAPDVLQFYGRLEVGRTYGNTATASGFDDAFKTLVCPGGYVREGFNVLEFEIGASGTTVAQDNITILGTGRNSKRLYFDATLESAGTGGGDVDTTLDEINYTAHGLFTGERILYDRNGNAGSYVTGAAANGESELVTGTTGEYYYAINVSANVFAVASSFANARAGTRLALSAVTNEIHYFERGPDTRPDIIVTGNTGTFSFTNGNLNNCRDISLNGNNAEIANTNIVTPRTIDLNTGGLITDCAVIAPVRTQSQPLMTLTGAEFEGVTGTSFIGNSDIRGPGHVFEITSATGSPFDSDGNLYTNYASYSGTDFEWDGSSGTIVDTTGNDITITGHPYTDGELVYYEDNGGTAVAPLTDGGLYYIGSIDANTVALYNNREDALDDVNRISLTTVGTGTTHRFDSANAAIWNNTGSNITINISGSGDTPSVRNTGAVSTTINNNVQVTFSNLKDNSEVRIYATGTNTELAGIENAITGTPDNRSFQASIAAATSVDYVIHNFQPGVTVYETIRVNGFTWPSTPQTIVVQQRIDRNVA